MGTTIRRLMPSGMYRTGILETWFHDMSLEGLHVNEFGYYFAAFDKGEPKDIRYSMDIMAKDPGKEELQIYSDCGWDHVSYRRDVHLFRTDGNSGARALHTDKHDRELSVRRLERKMRIGIAVSTVLLAASIIAMVYMLMYDRDFLLSTLERGSSSISANLTFFIILTVRAAEEFTGIRELGRHLRGEAEQKTGWRQTMRIRKGYLAAMALVVILTISATVSEIADTGVATMDEYPASLDVLRLPDIETRKDLYSNNEQDSFFIEPKSLLADSMYIASEELFSNDGYESHISLHFYDLRFPSITEKVIDGWEYRISKGVLSKPDDPYLDYLSFEEKSGGCYVFASKGDLALVAMYTGNEASSLVVSSVREYLMRIDGNRK
jgi:hypothetical protein